jgi:hypothetical protein
MDERSHTGPGPGVPFKDHLEQALEAIYREFACQRDALTQHIRAAEMRMDKTERDIERRLGETEKKVDTDAKRLEALVSDRQGSQTAWSRIIAVSGVVAAVIGTMTAAVLNVLHNMTVKP